MREGIEYEESTVREQVNEESPGLFRPKAARLEDPTRIWSGPAASVGRPEVLSPDNVLGLQRAVGNAGVTALLESDQESEADHAGDRSPVHDVINSGGRPLDHDVRTEMEGRLGHDFGDVRIHDDAQASDSARAVNAHAYTVGSNIVFQRDHADPSSDAGKTTLAHELTHVIQQRSGPVEGTAAPGGIKVSDPGDRFETEAAANADRVMSAPMPAAAAPTELSASGPAVQREEIPEEEEETPVQGSFVQRHADHDEESAASEV